MAKQTESRLVAEIRKRLTALGWLTWKNHGGPMSTAGLPDIMAVKDGRLLAIECKVGTNKPTKLQEHTLAQLAAHGCLTAVAYSWADVERALSNAAEDRSAINQARILGRDRCVSFQAKEVRAMTNTDDKQKCPHCDHGCGWSYPNLGVNCSSGMAVALSVNASLGGGVPWIRCDVCNKDGQKPKPQERPRRSTQ